jgi:hypothetical protein
MDAMLERLPHVDEHALVVAAGREATWTALLRVVEGTVSAGAAPRFARILGCADTAAAGPRPLTEGSALPGFHVASAERPAELALAGRHRFSDYALIFQLEELGPERTRVRAETRAEFPDLKGAIYKGLVIGTRLTFSPPAASSPASSAMPSAPKPAGLCDSCRHQRLVPTTRGSVFSLCERSRTDPAYRRYPAIPVLRCAGFEPGQDPDPAPPR